MGEPFPLDFSPGIVKVDAPYALRGRYIDCNMVRFVKGKPEKHRGFTMFSEEPLTGFARAALAWDDFGANRRLAVGTHLKLQLLDSAGMVQDITPFRDEGTLGNDPFAVTNGLTTVVVTDAAHGLNVDDIVYFDGATAGGGITIDGQYTVTAVIDLNTYEIEHSVAASSTDATTGGAAVTYAYEISPGNVNVQQGRGWGVGTWGTGTWGTPRENANFTQYARTWSLDLYGENLLAMPSGLNLYEWDPDSPTERAALVANSPTGNFMFVTNERYPVVLGVDGDLMTIAWPDQNDITDWTPAADNTALRRTLSKGSRMIAGAVLRNTLSILWSDSTPYTMQYSGRKNIIYETLPAADQCGLIGPQAWVVAGGNAYWMSNFNFHMYAGGVQKIPNSEDIRDWLYARLNPKQNWKCQCSYSSTHNEVRWNYVHTDDNEPFYYVAVCLDDFSWTVGAQDRSVFEERSGINPAVYGISSDGNVYEHEIGVDADGAAMSWFLESAPLDIKDGDRLIDMHGYIPNFFRQVGGIEVTIQGWDHPQQVTPIDTFTGTIAEQQGIVDMNMSGRQMSIRLSGDQVGSDFRLGIGKVEIHAGGRRRASA